MNNWKWKLMQFMQGRYGNDELGKAIYWGILILLVLSLFGFRYGSRIALVLLIFYYFRFFSKNHEARRRENQIYLQKSYALRIKLTNWKQATEYRKTHKVFKCSKCKKKLSVPRGKGKIEVSCPCGNRIIKKT